MKNNFFTFAKECYSFLSEQENNNQVSIGYATMVNTIYNLLKYDVENLDPKYYNLSDNKITNSSEAYRYIDVFSKLLPNSIKSELKNDDVGDTKSNDIINLDESTLVEMGNVAIKSLFYPEKDGIEFKNKIYEIDRILSSDKNKVTVNNAYSVYQEIKNFVSLID
jgi:hypothetical protein